ncbi:complement C1q and tumor necrosis factor-related protein 9-like [Triplophysa dalaica]|uniref:complement C1q and tumor necrosis factor-related protein 9A n=1 Tax=Triplophysa dalaica TaxID=1582913 RepID=UPI0024DFF561|nr:complement C1q and tumor necrosis factor-related protein 9A [Triplophysa dalaica]XP_056594646.1 complement C1q and tumor necrosis factor-related protein 9-like [Triplophysa dalaica]
MLFPRQFCMLFLFVSVNAAEQEVSGKPNSCMCGHPGIPGDPGHNGMPGRDGRDGARGDKGDGGTCGESGQNGPKGDKGELGIPGIAGIKGQRGEDGERGPPGKMGPQGFPGPLGLKGQKGQLGFPGPPGIKGEMGPVGPAGPQGDTGPKGERGLIGPLGHQGRPGPKGDFGPQGVKGSIGVHGDKGSIGEIGKPGPKGDMPEVTKSAFSVGLTVESRMPPGNTPIRFDKILYNQQGHYDPETGRFTCSVSGAYFFTYYITVLVRDVQVAMVKNGQKMIHTLNRYQNGEDQASGGAILELQAGDKVWLQASDGERFNGLFADEDDDTIFAGFLLFATESKPSYPKAPV